MIEKYLIWSNEHRAWWKPSQWGYTTVTHKAGRYAREQAEAIVAKANITVKPGDTPNEIMVLAPSRAQFEADLLTELL